MVNATTFEGYISDMTNQRLKDEEKIQQEQKKYKNPKQGEIAQMAEQVPRNRKILSSIPG